MFSFTLRTGIFILAPNSNYSCQLWWMSVQSAVKCWRSITQIFKLFISCQATLAFCHRMEGSYQKVAKKFFLKSRKMLLILELGPCSSFLKVKNWPLIIFLLQFNSCYVRDVVNVTMDHFGFWSGKYIKTCRLYLDHRLLLYKYLYLTQICKSKLKCVRVMKKKCSKFKFGI